MAEKIRKEKAGTANATCDHLTQNHQAIKPN